MSTPHELQARLDELSSDPDVAPSPVALRDLAAQAIIELRRALAPRAFTSCDAHWLLEDITTIEHVEGCACGSQDAVFIDEDDRDPRCVDGEVVPTFVRYEGEYGVQSMPVADLLASIYDDPEDEYPTAVAAATSAEELLWALGINRMRACWMQVPRDVVDAEDDERALERVEFLRQKLGQPIVGIKVLDPASPEHPDDLFVAVWGEPFELAESHG